MLQFNAVEWGVVEINHTDNKMTSDLCGGSNPHTVSVYPIGRGHWNQGAESLVFVRSPTSEEIRKSPGRTSGN